MAKEIEPTRNRSIEEILESSNSEETAISKESEEELLGFIDTLNENEEDKKEIIETKEKSKESENTDITDSYSKKEKQQEEIQKRKESKENDELLETQEETNFLLGGLKEAFEKIVEFEKNRKPSVITKGYETIKEKGGEIVEKAKNSNFLQSLMKGAIIAFIIGLYKWFQEAKKHEGGVIGWIAEKVWNLIKKAWDKIKSIDYEKIWEKIKEFFTSENFIYKFFWDQVVPYFTDGKFWEHLQKTGDFLKRIGEMIAPAIDEWYTALFGKYWTDYVKPFFQNSFLALVDWWGTVEAAGGIWSWLKYAVWKIFDGVKILGWDVGEALKTANISKIEARVEEFKSKKEGTPEATVNKEETTNIENTTNISKNNKKEEQYFVSNTDNFSNFIKPLNTNKIVNQNNMKNQYFRNGVIISAKMGDNIKSIYDGTVIVAKSNPLYGNFTIIKHGNHYSYYGFQKSINVKKGDTVKKGQIIGTVGNTGRGPDSPSLYFRVTKNGKNVDVQNEMNFNEFSEEQKNVKNIENASVQTENLNVSNESQNTNTENVFSTTNNTSSKNEEYLKNNTLNFSKNSFYSSNKSSEPKYSESFYKNLSNSSVLTESYNPSYSSYEYAENANIKRTTLEINSKTNNINNTKDYDQEIRKLNGVTQYLTGKMIELDKPTTTEGFLGTFEQL